MSHAIIAPLGGGVQPRLEINTLVHDNRQFSLYIQALTKMQQVDQALTPSFFQVAGIHGLPFVTYDGAVGQNGFTANPNNQWAGYCTHGSTLFPTWHRPYVMLIEQIINQHAQQIAGTYTTSDKNEWIDAATKLRQPYWDWAQQIVPPPQVISMNQVEITAPDGSRRNVTNPLIRYTFQRIEAGYNFPRPYNRWKTTLRQPDSTAANAKDNVPRLISILQNSQRDVTADTYTTLTTVHDWRQFSNHDPTFGNGNSIESVHDNIHVLVGGNGDMSDPSVAAFDPIFFLHHANVDRMISLWSALNPGVWLTAGNAQLGTYTLGYNQSVGASTPLTPFWKSQSSFWLSTDVVDINALGYTYPEFQNVNTADQNALKTAIGQYVNATYGPQSPVMTGRRSGSSRRDLGDLFGRHGGNKRRHHELASRVLGGGRLGQMLGDIFGGRGGTYSDWNVRVEFDRMEVGRSFSVIFFMDSVPEDPQEWLTCDQFVGAHHAFVRGTDSCEACANGMKTREEGFVSLNHHIADKSDLLSFAADLVAPLLGKKLQWRVLSTDGKVIDLKSLQVTVLEVPLHLSPGAYLPTVGKVVSWQNITQGRNGGSY
ncbi:hypothetical protein D9756_010920 [Leucocoprinus leucothites]|uniref:tyrosinase n=1 Tax=Leucocoprinus leucothites TaxID=201217 RepID=A0A8H5CSR4_9AGAR|nr:hypothetical protein D9756_010920 [Leucoagaricus leucothites]